MCILLIDEINRVCLNDFFAHSTLLVVIGLTSHSEGVMKEDGYIASRVYIHTILELIIIIIVVVYN